LNDGEAVTLDPHGNVIRRRRWKDEHGNILRDGEVLRVPMMLSDSKAKATDAEVIAAASAVKYDAASIDSRPRAAFTDAQKQAAAERQAAYDKRLSDAWKQEPPTIVADASKLTATMSVLGSMATENAFKAATTAGDPQTLDQARRRYHQRLESAWKQEGDQ
jgi:protein required for attachment to host cells